MILCEGPDGSGKTTLAKKLCEELSLEYRRPPEAVLSSTHGPAGPGLVEWWRTELRRPTTEQRQGVYDRTFWVSEAIYQLASGRAPLCSGEDYIRGQADLWASSHLVLIFCMTNETSMLENTYNAGRPRLIGVDEQQFRGVNFLYWALFGVWRQASDCVYHYDYQRHDVDILIEAIEGGM